MKTYRLPTGLLPRLVLTAAAFSLLVLAGCAHRELTAPCSDYKAASLTPTTEPSPIPCDNALPMQRPPWVASLDRAAAGGLGG